MPSHTPLRALAVAAAGALCVAGHPASGGLPWTAARSARAAFAATAALELGAGDAASRERAAHERAAHPRPPSSGAACAFPTDPVALLRLTEATGRRTHDIGDFDACTRLGYGHCLLQIGGDLGLPVGVCLPHACVHDLMNTANRTTDAWRYVEITVRRPRLMCDGRDAPRPRHPAGATPTPTPPPGRPPSCSLPRRARGTRSPSS